MSSTTCWQFEIKEKKRIENNGWTPTLVNSGEIKRINYRTAKEFILEYEWLKNIGSTKYAFGYYFNKYLSAVVCYTSPVSPYAYNNLLGIEEKNSILQLNRGASTYWTPKNIPSKLISNSMKILASEMHIKAIIAYADTEAGEIGTIYQACNALYLGLTDAGGAKMYTIKGKEYHPRKVHKLFGTRNPKILREIDPNYSTREIRAKHRYIFLLGSKTQKRRLKNNIEHLIKPYPKRVIL